MYRTSENYKNNIYSDETRHILKVFIDNTEIESKYIGDFKSSFKIFDNDEFYLGYFIYITVKLKIHKIKIITGILEEEIPYGEFIIDDKKEVNNNAIELELIDYMPKFNFDYNTTVTFPATLYNIAEDICTQAGVELRFYFFFKSKYSG